MQSKGGYDGENEQDGSVTPTGIGIRNSKVHASIIGHVIEVWPNYLV